MRVAKTRRLRFGFALVFAALFAASVASADESIPEEAKLYFQNGVDLIQASPPNYEDGYYQFKLAYEKSHSWKVLGNLGLCALKLERDGEALQYYTEYLKSGGSDIDPDERAALERDMMIINGNAGAVNLTSSVPNAALKDARAGSTAPPQQYTFEGETLKLRVRAGSHTFVVTAPDGNSLSWEVVLEPGKTAEHRFDFPSGASASKGATSGKGAETTSNPEPEKAGSPLRTVGFVTAGVGGAVLIAGVITGFMAKSKDKEATGQCDGKSCPTAAEKDFDAAHSLATVTNVLLIGGGVLAAAGVTMILVGGKSSSEAPEAAARSPRLMLAPALGSSGGGLLATGSF